jgi:dihydrofolate reductase
LGWEGDSCHEPAPDYHLHRREREGALAIAGDGSIGIRGGLPWHLPAELHHFKRVTQDRILVMGRKTWQSLPGPLPGRKIRVLSRSAIVSPEVEWHADLSLALQGRVTLAGGAGVYLQGLPLLQALWLTQVDCRPGGDTRLELDLRDWKTMGEWHRPADGRNAHSFTVSLLHPL